MGERVLCQPSPSPSRKSAFARVCQPGPSALSLSSTSGSSIIDIRRLRASDGNGGRPLLKRCASSIVSSRTSPSLSVIGFDCIVCFPFSRVSLSQGYNAQPVISDCIGDADEVLPDVAKNNIARFPIISSAVLGVDSAIPIEIPYAFKIKSTLRKGFGALCGIILDLHVLNVCIENSLVNFGRPLRARLCERTALC
ncbi:hypothetical protein LOKVESSMR4R_03866 [Yoonia vestfoldensis]|uniref:Uncharacterized protein n=1 Tax=Yoonia vestfoldensis TaxID=245188 RepID=A0A1Y0EI79_9RHOB|nr:hypothetical protein LOKVESSMR4R_03866 [Yoonia vestfoldensis]